MTKNSSLRFEGAGCNIIHYNTMEIIRSGSCQNLEHFLLQSSYYAMRSFIDVQLSFIYYFFLLFGKHFGRRW